MRKLNYVDRLIRSVRDEGDLPYLIVRWSGLNMEEAATILKKLEDRAEALGLVFPRNRRIRKLMDIAALNRAGDGLLLYGPPYRLMITCALGRGGSPRMS